MFSIRAWPESEDTGSFAKGLNSKLDALEEGQANLCFEVGGLDCWFGDLNPWLL